MAWLLLIATFLLWPGFSSQKACDEPDEVDFGEIVSAEKAKYLENDRVQYRCNPGYVLEGPEWIQCKGQEWTPHPPKCLAPCSVTRRQLAAKNLFVFGNQRKARLIQSNQSLQFQCNKGYVLGVPSVRKCVDGYIDLPLCISERGKNCSGPPRTENGDITTLSEKQYRSGSSVEFRCQNYYAIEGQNRSFCDNGTWTKVPICLDPCLIPRTELESQKIEVKDEIDVPENIFVQHGLSIELTCKTGYVLAANSSQSTFLIHCDGRLPLIPKCKEITCNSPRISNGTFRPQRTIYHDGDLIRIRCDPEFTIKPDDREKVVECTKNGWSPPPKCIKTTCQTHPIKNGNLLSPKLIYKVGERVQFSCNTGYRYIDRPDALCTETGWSSKLQCAETTCQADPIENGNLLSPKLIYKDGETVQFSCNVGYRYIDRPYALCTETGWSSKLQCAEITCFPPEVTNGHFLPRRAQYMYNEKIDITCNEGFVSESLRKPSICKETGWVPLPVCKRKGCDYIDIENGRMTDHLEYYKPFPKWEGQSIQFYCFDGFLPANKETWQTATCRSSRYVPEVKCFKRCDPYVRFYYGRTVYNFRNKYIEGDNITFTCDSGYSPANQQSTITCTKYGWSPAPRCIQPDLSS
ncbi:complement factor H-like isoform X2 [Erythrolamprus reginae]|uniref:complement factor H-like isoform X2 n=1 Tax=Erythrolamprus reginae TaxID=121349 RepID=UPI00396CA60E